MKSYRVLIMDWLPAEIINTLCEYLEDAQDVLLLAAVNKNLLETFKDTVRVKHFTVPPAAFATQMAPVFRGLRCEADNYSTALATGMYCVHITYSTWPSARNLVVPEGVRELRVTTTGRLPFVGNFKYNPDKVACPSTLERLFIKGGYMAEITNIPTQMALIYTENPLTLHLPEQTYHVKDFTTVLMNEVSDRVVAGHGLYHVRCEEQLIIPKTSNCAIMPLNGGLYYTFSYQVFVPHMPDLCLTTYTLVNYLEISGVSAANPLKHLVMIPELANQDGAKKMVTLGTYLNGEEAAAITPIAKNLGTSLESILSRDIQLALLPHCKKVEFPYFDGGFLLVKYSADHPPALQIAPDITYINVATARMLVLFSKDVVDC